jgi:hypothetical protein
VAELRVKSKPQIRRLPLQEICESAALFFAANFLGIPVIAAQQSHEQQDENGTTYHPNNRVGEKTIITFCVDVNVHRFGVLCKTVHGKHQGRKKENQAVQRFLHQGN